MRDKNGRFIKKEEEGLKVNFSLPSMKTMICWIILFVIMLPWMEIVSKLKIFQKIFDFVESLMLMEKDALETPKKNGLFS